MSDKGRSGVVQVVVNDELQRLIEKAAEEAGLSVSSYGRMLLVSGLRQRGYTLAGRNVTSAPDPDTNREEPTP